MTDPNKSSTSGSVDLFSNRENPPVVSFMTGYTVPAIIEIRYPPATRQVPLKIRIERGNFEGPYMDFKPIVDLLRKMESHWFVINIHQYIFKNNFKNAFSIKNRL